ncbi:uncharacterized protein LOC141641458 [Silene latifolia]|uniref:uncharacterized protein LOC141641458 n=1 Tax=Silene latifolia TaxID=37657 RepID=UPI003D772863
MTETDQETVLHVNSTTALNPAPDHSKKKRWRKVCLGSCMVILLIIAPILIILSLTVFKIKAPKIELVSSSVDGIAQSFSFPTFKVHLNITLNLTLMVHNPNHVSFKAGQGDASVFYMSNQVADVLTEPGLIPSKGSATLICLLTLETDQFTASGFMPLANDIMAGELGLDVKTRIPGRAKILVFRKHVVTTSDCQIVIGLHDMQVISQDCKQHAKL